MKHILLLDTGFTAGLILNELEKNKDNKVFVMGGNLSDCLANCAPNYICENYSNISAVQKYIESHQIDLIIPGCNDVSYEIAAQLSLIYPDKVLNIDSPETIFKLTQKKAFREFAALNYFPIPRLFSNDLNNIPEDYSGDFIIKPVDAFSGKGVSIILNSEKNKMADAILFAKHASRTQEYVIEEYISGQLFSHSAFICSGNIQTDFFVKEYCLENPFAVDTSYLDFEFPEQVKLKIREIIENMACKLSLKDGLIHTQFILNGEGFYLIEITRRCPGDLYAHLIQSSTGFSYIKAYLSTFLNQSFNFKYIEQKKFILRKTLTKKEGDFLFSIEFKKPLNLKSFVPLLISGGQISPAPVGRVGVAFFECKTWEELKETCHDFLTYQSIELKNYANFY